MALAGAVYGTVDMNADEHAYISNLLKENVKIVNNQLKQKQWICGGERPTFADYMLVIAVAELQQFAMDTNLRNSLNNLNNHFKKVSALPEVKSRLGNLKQGKKAVPAACLAQEKKADAPAAGKKAKKP